MHWGEKLVADFLNAAGIEWHYEPHCFDLGNDHRGRPMGFRPDFYLPAFDLYVEVTTAKQRNTTRKHRKVRLLRERYPHVNVQLLERRDILRLSEQTFELDDLFPETV